MQQLVYEGAAFGRIREPTIDEDDMILVVIAAP